MSGSILRGRNSAIALVEESRRENQPSGFAERFEELGEFLRGLRRQLRFGELSRAPLRLMRFQLNDGSAECDLIARPADKWDADLPHGIRERHWTLQALEDAMAIRKLLFSTLPDLNSAEVRVYRQSTAESVELIITGTITREESGVRVVSPVMRAKLCGFRFCLDDEILMPLAI